MRETVKEKDFYRKYIEEWEDRGSGRVGGGHPLFIISLLSRPRARLREVADQTTYVSVYDHWGGLDGH